MTLCTEYLMGKHCCTKFLQSASKCVFSRCLFRQRKVDPDWIDSEISVKSRLFFKPLYSLFLLVCLLHENWETVHWPRFQTSKGYTESPGDFRKESISCLRYNLSDSHLRFAVSLHIPDQVEKRIIMAECVVGRKLVFMPLKSTSVLTDKVALALWHTIHYMCRGVVVREVEAR